MLDALKKKSRRLPLSLSEWLNPEAAAVAFLVFLLIGAFIFGLWREDYNSCLRTNGTREGLRVGYSRASQRAADRFNHDVNSGAKVDDAAAYYANLEICSGGTSSELQPNFSCYSLIKSQGGTRSETYHQGRAAIGSTTLQSGGCDRMWWRVILYHYRQG